MTSAQPKVKTSSLYTHPQLNAFQKRHISWW